MAIDAFEEAFEDYRSKGEGDNRAVLPKSGVTPQFKPGPTWPGLIPPDYVLENAKARGEDPNLLMPPSLRDNRPKSAYQVWNDVHPQVEEQVTVRQGIILSTMAVMVKDSASLDENEPHYPRLGLLKATLRERGSLNGDEVEKLDADSRDYLFKLYLRVHAADKSWQETVRGMKKAK